MFAKPDVGSVVEITVRQKNQYYYATTPTIDIIYTGTVVPSNSWDQPNTVKLHTGNPNHPDSIIQLKNINDIKNADGSAAQQAAITTNKTWQVPSSKGAIYTVTKTGDKFTCNCVGFQYRRHCKHIIDDIVNKEGVNAVGIKITSCIK